MERSSEAGQAGARHGLQPPKDGGTSCGGAAAAHLAPLCSSEGAGWQWWCRSATKMPGEMGSPLTGTQCLQSLGEGERLRGFAR